MPSRTANARAQLNHSGTSHTFRAECTDDDSARAHVLERAAPACNGTDAPDSGTLHAFRSEASLRHEAVYRDWASTPPSDRPLAIARALTAKAFDSFMHNRWLAGDEGVSNTVVARTCGVDVKIVRCWRQNEKPMPVAALRLVPSRLYETIITDLSLARGRPLKRGVVVIREGLERLKVEARTEDRSELLRAIAQAQAELAELATQLTEKQR